VRAAVLREIGGTLEYTEVPDPVPGEGEVVVDITHAAVNPLDIWISRGSPGAAAANLPWIPGTEGAGEYDGQPVLIRATGHGIVRPGLFASKAAVSPAALVPLAEGVDRAVACAIGVAGVTAWNCVNVVGQSSPEDRVLVLGASGGVGSLAVQVAKATGATVWGQTTNAAKVAAVDALGADRTVVADAESLAEAVSELRPTLVIDGLGGTYTPAAVAALEPRGRLVLYGASASDDIPLSSRGFYRKGISMFGYTGLIEPPERQAALVTQLLELVGDGRLVVPIELVPLSSAASAFQRILDRRVEGKLVLDTSR
jgi:NADPH2:quinone reductase